jgi:hypothetical protein
MRPAQSVSTLYLRGCGRLAIRVHRGGGRYSIGRTVRAAGIKLVQLPPAAPEPNPPERLFEERRRSVVGQVYATLAEKQAAVERELAALAGDPARVRQLAGWAWIRTALPPPNYAAPI